MFRKPLPVRLLLHVVLIVGGISFAMPFIWMLGTSLMTDKEITRPGFHPLPEAPRQGAVSPFIDANEFRDFTQPSSIGEPAWTEFKASVRQAVRDRIHALGVRYPDAVDAGIAEDAVVTGAWDTVQGRISPEVWKARSPDAIRQAIDANLTPDVVRGVLDACYQRVRLGLIQVRTTDFHQRVVTPPAELASIWRVENGPIRLVPAGTEADPHVEVHYDFSRERKASLVADVDLPVPIEKVRQVRYGICGDDTWHRYHSQLEVDGRLYETQRVDYLYSDFWSEMQLQFYTPSIDEDPLRAKTWVPLRLVDEGPRYFNEPGRLRLRILLEASNDIEAWYGKAIHNYRETLRNVPFLRYAATSIVLVVLNIVLATFSCSLVAYAFARLEWPGRDVLFLVLLGTMMIPSQVTMIPGFVIIKKLGWYNTLTPLWAFAAFGTAFNIFLLRQFMKSIPKDLEDAAYIDGCGFLRVYWHVMLPLVKPTLAAIAIFTFMGSWNDFLGPLIYINDQRLYNLALGLFAFTTDKAGNQPLLMAGAALMTIPIVVVFFFAQKYFIQGVTLTGMKG